MDITTVIETTSFKLYYANKNKNYIQTIQINYKIKYTTIYYLKEKNRKTKNILSELSANGEEDFHRTT